MPFCLIYFFMRLESCKLISNWLIWKIYVLKYVNKNYNLNFEALVLMGSKSCCWCIPYMWEYSI